MTETEKNDADRLSKAILRIVNDQKPDTMRQLVYLVSKETGVAEEKIVTVIQKLEDEKKIEFAELLFPQALNEYVFSFRGTWFWLTISLLIVATFSIFMIPENFFPLSYIRNFFGLLFVLYLPGYSLIKTLYPISVPLKTSSLTLDSIERIVLSLGLSLAVTPIVGLMLYYTPWGLGLTPITLSLLFVIAVFATLGVLREYQARKALFLKRVIAVTEYELADNILRFFATQGFVKKRRVIVKEILVAGITAIDSHDNELSVTHNGVTNIFLMSNAKSCSSLRDKMRDMIVDGTK
ncbi:MAG: DUF1616 domain-containing protein [Candidatus Bathyarchaeota archaeon]|nr:DUF1616 domain-containing protein [Candidatus Bathyarchaeota archaeon]